MNAPFTLMLAAGLLLPSTSLRGPQVAFRTGGGDPEAAAGAEPADRGFAAELSGVVDPDQYRVGPGDQFGVWIWGPISRTMVVTVGPEGNALLPEIGTVNVAGISLRDACQRLRDRVRGSLRGVEAEVHLTKLRTFRIYLTGAVTHPGPISAMGTSRVADVLADTLLAPGASRRNIEVARSDGSRVVVDLRRFQLAGEPVQDPWLREGDVVRVPLAVRWVGAWGAVGRPGTLELGPADSVSTLLRLAGGLLPSALPESTQLVRWRNASSRDTTIVRIVDGERAVPDIPLRDGDQLYVLSHPAYHESQQVTVVGRVQREGVFPIRLGHTRLTEVIAAAGGFRDDADISAVHLIRGIQEADHDPEFDRLLRLSRSEMTMSEYESFRARLAARTSDTRVDWTQLAAGRRELDLLLQNGDVIRVERRTTAVRVDGQVRRPGWIPFAPGRTYAYYLREAGGLTRRAARTQVRLTRAGSGQNMLVRDASSVLPGDQLWVPERPDISPWQYFRDALIVAAQVATVWLAVRK